MVMTNDSRFMISFPDVDLGLQIISTIRKTGPGQDEPSRAALRDTPVIFDDWSAGGGISQAMEAIPGGFSYARNVVTRFPGVLTLSGQQTEVVVNIPGATLGEINGSFEQDNTLYFLAGRYVIPIVNGVDPGPIITVGGGVDLGSNVVAISAVDFGNAVVVGTAGGTLWKKVSAGGWTNLNPNTGVATTVKRTLLRTAFWSTTNPADGVYAGYYVLVGVDADDPRAVKYCAAEPLVPGNWSAAVPILNRSYPINSLAGSNRHIWVCTAATVADLDQRNEPVPLNLSYFQFPYDAARNGEQSLYHNGFLYVTHVRGLDRQRVGGATIGSQNAAQREDLPGWCDWRQGISAETPVVPRRWSNLIALDGFIVAGVWNGTDSYINFGRDRSELSLSAQKGPGPLGWFLGEYYLPGERITHIKPTSPTTGQPRLWICSVDGSGNTRIRWASLPFAASPMEEINTNLDTQGAYVGGHRFNTSGLVRQSKIDLEDQAARKIPDRYDIRADRLVNPTTVVSLQANAEDGPMVGQGTVVASPRGSLIPIDPLTTGMNIGLEIGLQGTNLLTPIVREVRMRTRVRVEQAPNRQYQALIGPVQETRNSGWDDSTPQERIDKLTALATRGPVTMIDEFGDSRRVIVEEGIEVKPQKVYLSGVDRYEEWSVATFAISILPTSAAELALDQVTTPTVVLQPPFWDDGSVWEP
jgi:hypothetical protein